MAYEVGQHIENGAYEVVALLPKGCLAVYRGESYRGTVTRYFENPPEPKAIPGRYYYCRSREWWAIGRVDGFLHVYHGSDYNTKDVPVALTGEWELCKES